MTHRFFREMAAAETDFQELGAEGGRVLLPKVRHLSTLLCYGSILEC